MHRTFLTAATILLLGGCPTIHGEGDGDPAISPLGGPCEGNADCEGTLECVVSYPGGYCTERCAEARCSAGATCVEESTPICLSACEVDAECRAGYVCGDGACRPGVRPRLTVWGDQCVSDANTPGPCAFGPANAERASVGHAHSCAIDLAGELRCVGEYQGDAPDGLFTDVVSGAQYACATRREDGRPVCWGLDRYGRTAAPDVPLRDLSLGWRHACGLDEASEVVCWGDGRRGATAAPPGPFQSVAAGKDFTCAVRPGGSVECWGLEACESCGPAASAGQTQAPAGEFQRVVAGSYHACALAMNGRVTCWGDPPAGGIPARSFAVLAAGHDHTCGVTTPGPTLEERVMCWSHRPRELDVDGVETIVLAGPLASTGSNVGGTRVCVVDGYREECAMSGDSYYSLRVPARGRDRVQISFEHPSFAPALLHWDVDMHRPDFMFGLVAFGDLEPVVALGIDVEHAGAIVMKVAGANHRDAGLSGVAVSIDRPVFGPLIIEGGFPTLGDETGPSGEVGFLGIPPGRAKASVGAGERVCDTGVSWTSGAHNEVEFDVFPGWASSAFVICQ